VLGLLGEERQDGGADVAAASSGGTATAEGAAPAERPSAMAAVAMVVEGAGVVTVPREWVSASVHRCSFLVCVDEQ